MSYWTKIKAAVQQAWHSLVHLDDTPHRIAWGSALGMFVAFLPIVGIQMATSALLAKIFRGNVTASLPWAWITNPITIPPIYYGTFKLGALFTGDEITFDAISTKFTTIGDMGFWRSIYEGYRVILDIFGPMVIGGVIAGAFFGAITYFSVKTVVIRLRRDSSAKQAGITSPSEDPSISTSSH